MLTDGKRLLAVPAVQEVDRFKELNSSLYHQHDSLVKNGRPLSICKMVEAVRRSFVSETDNPRG
jgi:hypothetical protein